MLKLYSVFHLNLAFSSIEEKQWPQVIHHCYWPLLRLIRDYNLPLGIEASGFTLEVINRLDPAWVKELKQLCHTGMAEFVGSGYSQLIGPLVPSEVNRWNQQLGLDCYQQLLNLRPQLALVNEQAFSAGIVSHYSDAGYAGLIMEWDNPAHGHPEWPVDLRYLPQRVNGLAGGSLPLIWNMSLPFQQFQRYAHGELSLDGYLPLLEKHLAEEIRVFSLYGNDAEIFDFRPGRFATESVQVEGEWQRIEVLYQRLQTDPCFMLIKPSDVLSALDLPGAGGAIDLQTSAQPVPVKKQPKYNITRWAVTGRDDLGLNTACWQLYELLKESKNLKEHDWKELCYLWSSDFRTHITSNRWQGVQERLTAFQRKVKPRLPVALSKKTVNGLDHFVVKQEGAFLDIETPSQHLRLNCYRGLVIESWRNKKLSEQPLIKTLPHGYFDDIHFGADYYTGHFVLEVPGQHKITDLTTGAPRWEIIEDSLVVSVEVDTPFGRVRKEILIDSLNPEFGIAYRFCWPNCPNGTLRVGHVTLNPELFHHENLFYRTHNGGETAETFYMGNSPFNHLAPVSTLVSSADGLGVTAGVVEIGDDRHSLLVTVDKCSAALTGHIVYAPVDRRYFSRLIFSA
ncbi:MAG: glycoside hydrolase family 57, partial [Deltaproteobacteria bacterium]